MSECDVCGREHCPANQSIADAATPEMWPLTAARCYRLGYDRLRASLTTAEKERDAAWAKAVKASGLMLSPDSDNDAWRPLRALLRGSIADAAPAANKASDSSALEKALGALRELLRLYDWRFELAKLESDARYLDTGSDFRVETRRLLRQYGAEKKAAWAAARAIVSGGLAEDGPKAP